MSYCMYLCIAIPYILHFYCHMIVFIIAEYISQYFTLEEGDLILTGTPAGVGPCKEGDVIEGEIPGITHFKFPIVKRK